MGASAADFRGSARSGRFFGGCPVAVYKEPEKSKFVNLDRFCKRSARTQPAHVRYF